MKKIYIYMNFVVLFLLSCGDNAVIYNYNAEPGKIKVLNNEENKFLEGYFVVVYSVITKVNQTINKSNFSIYPNPSVSDIDLKFQLNAKSNVELSIYNLQTEKTDVIRNANLNAGNYTFWYDFSLENSNLEGFYRSYLIINGEINDSLNIIYNKENKLISEMDNTYLLGALTTNQNGVVDFSMYNVNLIGEKYLESNANGYISGIYELSKNLKINIYNKEQKLIKVKLITVDDLLKSGLVIKEGFE